MVFIDLRWTGRGYQDQTLVAPMRLNLGPRPRLAMIVPLLVTVICISDLVYGQVVSSTLEDLLSRAVELEQSKDFAGAEGAYKEALLKSPDDPDILRGLGRTYQEEGKYAESIEAFQRILKRAPLYPGVNSLLAISYYALNQFDKTVAAARLELTGNPKDKQARYYLALALSASGKLFEAIEQLEAIRREDPQNLAVAYQLFVDYKAATQGAGQRLVMMDPDSEFTHAMKAEVLADGGRFEEALTQFKEVLRKNPNFPGIHLALGQVHWQRKDLEKSQQELELALLEDPNQPLANYYLADILVTNKEYPKALPHLEISVSVYPELTRAYWLLGKCYASTGDNEQAIKALNKALEQDPNYKEAHFQLHEVYARLGNKKESQRHLEIFERLTREDQDKDRARLQETMEQGAPRP